MNCKSVQNRLSAYVDRELGGDELLQIRAHISACPDCQAEADALRSLKFLLNGMGCPEPPEGLSERLSASVLRTRIEDSRGSFRITPLMFAGVAACSMLGTLLLINSGLGHRFFNGHSKASISEMANAPKSGFDAAFGSDSSAPIISAANFGPR